MFRLVFCLALVVPFVAGCGLDEPAGPVSQNVGEISADLSTVGQPTFSAWSDFFPLRIGNRWQYERTFTATTVLFDDPTPLVETVLGARESELVGVETWMERPYVVQEDRITEDVDPGDVISQRILFRQDRSGLYEVVDPSSGTTVAGDSRGTVSLSRRRTGLVAARATGQLRNEQRALAAAWSRLAAKLDLLDAALGRSRGGDPNAVTGRPGGPLEGELTRLAYPLRPGQRWTIAEAFRSVVVEHDVVEVPAGRFPAWRVKIESDYFEPGDEVYVWFGRHGQVAFEAHLSLVATDEDGQEIGTVHADETEILTDFDVERTGTRE